MGGVRVVFREDNNLRAGIRQEVELLRGVGNKRAGQKIL